MQLEYTFNVPLLLNDFSPQTITFLLVDDTFLLKNSYVHIIT